MSGGSGFGPWADHISNTERLARLREWRAISLLTLGRTHALTVALTRAVGGDDAAARHALAILDNLEALRRRRVLAAVCALSNR